MKSAVSTAPMPLELYRSADNVADALNHWHKAG